MIAFGPDVCGDWARATEKEWLETNGLGGYASSTIAGANTRRYHGLLIAALKPPTQRTLLLSKLEETLAVGEAKFDLSANQYPGAIFPAGYRHLREFRLDPFPTFVYEVAGGARIEKTVAMCRGLNGVIVQYRLLTGPGVVGLIVRPLINCRDHHHLTRERPEFDTAVDISSARDLVTVRPYPGVPPLQLHFPGSHFEARGCWYRNFEYAQEAARGLDFREDQYSPGCFICELDRGEVRHFTAAVDPRDRIDPAAAMAQERRRRRRSSPPPPAAEITHHLRSAADAFLVSSTDADEPDGVIAGYPWFEEWGRDTMISLPGLTLVTGRHDAARRIIRAYARYCRDGLIPNRIPDAGQEPHYNTADATLWMFRAVRKHLDATDDRDFVDGLLPTLLDIIEWHVRGTHYGIRADEDGLLFAGDPATQLTWMDAKVGDWVVTPRCGKPVEINALWHHALRFVEGLGVDHAGPGADRVAERFRERFWAEELGYLYDAVDGGGPPDSSLRPNQIIAVSLSSTLLDIGRARRVVAAVRRELLTPYGLRTLSPGDRRYRGRYEGDQWSRDGAYHQGTVWPWLLGPFITAHMRVAEDREAARREAIGWLEPIRRHLKQEAGLGSISEVFDGDPPHRPHGCIAQAWSVAEILRAAIEDLGLPMGELSEP